MTQNYAIAIFKNGWTWKTRDTKYRSKNVRRRKIGFILYLLNWQVNYWSICPFLIYQRTLNWENSQVYIQRSGYLKNVKIKMHFWALISFLCNLNPNYFILDKGIEFLPQIPISLKPNVVDRRYFKLWILVDQTM